MPTTINDELTRIESAKTAIATAIGGKGVTVPANAKIDDFANLIDAIQTGGGLTWNDVVKKTATSITLTEDEGLTIIPSYQFYNNTRLVSINFPNGITNIGEYAFFYCSRLTSIILPNTLTSIKNYGFYRCSSANPIILGNSLETIGSNAFAYCQSVQEIDIPSTATSIIGWAFGYCAKLSTLIIRSNSCELNNTNALSGTPIANGMGKIYVPYGYGNTYKGMSNWSAYANQIYELDENGNIPT